MFVVAVIPEATNNKFFQS